MFAPNLPQPNTEIDTDQMRRQLTSLKALIDAIVTITAAHVDGVTTGNPGDPATVDVSVVGNTPHLTFSIPAGSEGAPGEVTNADLNTAIAGTSSNSNVVDLLQMNVGDRPRNPRCRLSRTGWIN